MSPANSAATQGLPRIVRRVVDDFVDAALSALHDDLCSIVLYGSGAEGRLRATSDVNLIVVLRAFDHGHVDGLREAFRSGEAAARLTAMFILESEIPAATELFAGKFADVRRRHRVLYGDDPFADLQVSRSDLTRQLKQQLLNLTLRMRAAYVEHSLREEQLANVIAEVAGPLRTCAANLLELEGRPAPGPREALERIAQSSLGDDWTGLGNDLREARAHHLLPSGEGTLAFFQLLGIAQRMRERAEALA